MPSNDEEVRGAGFGILYPVMRFIGERCAAHFFRDVVVVGGDDVPKKGPIILCCTHFSTIMDVAIISGELPHRRPIHYWAKRGLYKRQPFRWILENSGNIQVDRKTKSNMQLFAGTFKAMESGEAIGLFPEGGSFTEHRLHSMKAGAAWAALEYARHLVEKGSTNPTKTKLLIIPAAINYTDKSRFRSHAVFSFGPAFAVDDYTKQFLAEDEVDTGISVTKEFLAQLAVNLAGSSPPTPGPSVILRGGSEGPHPESRMRLGLDIGNDSSDEKATDSNAPLLRQAALNGLQSTIKTSKAPTTNTSARMAVAKLTDRIGAEIYKMTIDAPDWRTWHSIKMTRELIWKRSGELPLQNLVSISNAIVAILNAPIPEARRANESLCNLQALVIASSTDVFTLNLLQRVFTIKDSSIRSSSATSIAIPSRKEASGAIPSLYATTAFLIWQILILAIRLPYVAPLAAIYLPAYAVGWGLSLRYASHEEESMASAKSLCAIAIGFITHGLLIFAIAALFLFTPPGWLLGIAVSIAIEKAHVYLLDETYNRIKVLVAAYRLFAASLGKLIRLRQYAAEDRVIRIATEIVKSKPAIQWTYIKALRTAAKVEHANDTDDASIPRGLSRPFCSQMMGVTLLAHVRAEHALNELFREMKRLEHHKQDLGSEPEATKDLFTHWTLLRNQMETSLKHKSTSKRE